MFEKGRLYRRQDDIHGEYGGQQEGGISTPSAKPYIFIFTGETDEDYGYYDRWEECGALLYYGEGQRGDMTFKRGNRAIRDHAENGKVLHLFEKVQREGGIVRYVGKFACDSWDYVRALDARANMRRAIVFRLVPVADETG